MSDMTSSSGFVPLLTSAPRSRVEWELEDDVTVPESELQDTTLDLLKQLFLAWAAREGNGAHVMRNRAIRWDEEHPRVGVDPDIAILASAPPEGIALRSVRTWLSGHTPPILAIEVVSENHPWKDYAVAPEKYAANGTEELWVFDPLLVGPRITGGPFPLQVWSRRADGGFERIYAGDGPARSPRLSTHGVDRWILITDEGLRLRVADDPQGSSLWLTGEERERSEKERERSEKERERSEKERERSEKERALAELAAVRAELAKQRGG